MTAVVPGRLAGPLLALALPALSAHAGGWEARSGRPLETAGFHGPERGEFAGPALVVEGRRLRDGAWEADAGSCVLRTVFDPVDGIEHDGTGAWLEVDISVDRAARGPGGRSAWGASLSDWHHEAAFWLVRSGHGEGVILESGGGRSPLLPVEVARTRTYRLVADETGAHLAVDGRPVLSLPLSRRARPGPPRIRLGAGVGAVRASLEAVDHGCLRPVEARLAPAEGGRLELAVLGHEGFRPALEVEPGSLRIDGLEPPAGSVREADLDGDGFLDLLMQLPEGLPLDPGELVHVDARTSEDLRLRAWAAPPDP